jgi:hypothetical protein
VPKDAIKYIELYLSDFAISPSEKIIYTRLLSGKRMEENEDLAQVISGIDFSKLLRTRTELLSRGE